MAILERLDTLIHHPRMAWIPRPLTSWVCDVMDHRLGLSWAEIRQARHGKQPGYFNMADWRTTVTNTAGAVTVHYKSGEVLRDD